MFVAPKKKREGSLEDVNMDIELMNDNNGHHIECIKKSTATTNGTIREHTKLPRQESSSSSSTSSSSPENGCESEESHETSPERQQSVESESLENEFESETKDKGQEQDVSTTSSENLESEQTEQRFLSQQYSVVKTLFEKLPMRDLLSCARVNKLWNDISKVVRKQRRNKPFVILYHPYQVQGRDAIVVEWFNGEIGNIVSNEAKEFVENSFSNFNSYPRVCEQVRPAILETFKNCYYEPQLVIFFGSQSMGQILNKRHTPKQRYTRYEHLFECLPNPALAAFGSGVVTTIKDSRKEFAIESENEAYPLLTGLALPKVPGLHVKVFDASRFKGKVDANNCKEVLNISPEDNVKGIILFQSMTRRSAALTDAVYHYLLINPNVAVGGGAMASLECSQDKGQRSEGKTKGCGLIICGDENLKVSSVGMFQRKMTNGKNEAALARVKKMNFEEEDSFAFMFACQGRGGKMHNDVSNFESNLFRKYFPKTLLVGGFTAGEYIHEHIPGEDSQPPSSKKSLEYTFSTVFVIVSVARPPASPQP